MDPHERRILFREATQVGDSGPLCWTKFGSGASLRRLSGPETLQHGVYFAYCLRILWIVFFPVRIYRVQTSHNGAKTFDALHIIDFLFIFGFRDTAPVIFAAMSPFGA